jgi:hypothetical protein
MAHQVLVILSYVCIGVVVGCLVLAFALEWRDATEGTREQRQGVDLDYERYAAEKVIRDTERRTIQEMLAVYHGETGGNSDVIEGTAIEEHRS